jgi:hypothetical protein
LKRSSDAFHQGDFRRLQFWVILFKQFKGFVLGQTVNHKRFCLLKRRQTARQQDVKVRATAQVFVMRAQIFQLIGIVNDQQTRLHE